MTCSQLTFYRLQKNNAPKQQVSHLLLYNTYSTRFLLELFQLNLSSTHYENNAPKQDRFSILLNSTIIFSIQFLRLTIKWQLWFTINKLINQNNPGVTCIKYTNLQLHHRLNKKFNQGVMDNWILHIANLFKKQWNHFNLFGFKIQGDRSN